LRAEAWYDGSLDARIREAAVVRRVPYVAVIGPREERAGQVSLRLRDGRRLDPMPAGAAVALIQRVVAARSPDLL
jgi:threonyl-tRNA synthetase